MNQQLRLREDSLTVCARNVRGDYSLNAQVLESLYAYYARRYPHLFDYASDPTLFVFMKSYYDIHDGEDDANRASVKKYRLDYDPTRALPSFVSRACDLLVEKGKIPPISNY